MFRILFLFALGLFVSACVPKTTYEDQQSKLKEIQEKLKDAEETSNVCDKNVVMQLREQAQSLDLLQQELIERNTELSKEVAKLRVFESQSKLDQLTCDKKLANAKEEEEGRIQRIRATYEDVIKELKAENHQLKDSLEAKNAPAVKAPTTKSSKSSSSKK
jgi:hypothetical protein